MNHIPSIYAFTYARREGPARIVSTVKVLAGSWSQATRRINLTGNEEILKLSREKLALAS